MSTTPLLTSVEQTPKLIIPQPDANGEFKTPMDGAIWMAVVHGKRQIPLNGKKAFLTDWDKIASTDPEQIREWYDMYRCNFGSLADNGPILEADSTEVRKRFGAQFSRTLTIESSPGKGHRYYLPADVEHIAQNATKHGDFSLRKHNAYCVSPGSVHPVTKKQYRVVVNAPMVVPTAEEIAFWNSERVEQKKETAAVAADEPIPQGKRNSTITSILGKARQQNKLEYDALLALARQHNERCTPPLPESELQTIARSIARYEVKPTGEFVFPESRPQVLVGGDQMRPAEPVKIDLSNENQIPPFDESVITGIYREIVDLATRGTTIPPQYAFLAAKVYLGARMAGRVTFEGLDCDSSYYGTAIGETGTSKGEAWRRTFEKILNPPKLTEMKPYLKVIYSADSGAGLKDAFFEPPTELPIVCYIDEITTLGHKAGEKKNPEILDTMIELADSHHISRVLAKRGGRPSSKTHDNARLSVFACGQDGPAFMGAFAGRTKLGIFERLYPEFSELIEAGDIPDINEDEILALYLKIATMNFNCKMTMDIDTECKLRDFWASQPGDIRRKVRLKKYLMLDMYMAVFGRGLTVAEPEDLEVAIKIFNRQMVIRRVHFTGEVPDRIGFYAGKIKAIIAAQRKELNNGKAIAQVALSTRDFQTMTNAFRDNELHTFERAWRSFSEHVVQVQVVAGNGQKYPKWIPMPYEHERWFPSA